MPAILYIALLIEQYNVQVVVQRVLDWSSVLLLFHLTAATIMIVIKAVLDHVSLRTSLWQTTPVVAVQER